LRSGDAHTANNFEGFLEDTLYNLNGKKVGLLRADSGFYQKTILEHLEHQVRPIPYIIAARLQGPVQRMLAAHRQWFEVEDGIEKWRRFFMRPMAGVKSAGWSWYGSAFQEGRRQRARC